MRLGDIALDISLDKWHLPYYIYHYIEDGPAAQYFGQHWFVIIHLFWWEIRLVKLA